LTGTWKDELLFVLRQALVIYDVYTAQIAVCDGEIEQYLQRMEARSGDPQAPLPDLPPAKVDSRSKNAPSFNARAQYARLLGVDRVAVMGLSSWSVQTIISEIGTDMSRFPSGKPFCAWLGVVPRNDISGGKLLRSRTIDRESSDSSLPASRAIGVTLRLGAGRLLSSRCGRASGRNRPRSPRRTRLLGWSTIC